MRNIQNERLKLLTTFKAVFAERTLVDAADVLGCTQSAVSKQLQKLRDWLQDDLFVRTPEGMMPTEKALSLIGKVELILEEIDGLNRKAPFDPGELEGRFVIETTDEISRRITAPLLRQIRKHAPNLSLAICRLERDYAVRKLESGEIDTVISVNWHAPDQLLQKRLFSDKFVVVMNERHELAGERLTTGNFAGAKHLLVAPLNSIRGYIDDILIQQGAQRDIALTVPTFSEVTPALLEDYYVVTLPNQVAIRLVDSRPLVIRSLPFEVPMFNYYLLWHRRFNNDSRHRWIRGLIEDQLGQNQVPV